MVDDRYTATVILKIAYGYTVQHEDDKIAKLADRAMDEFSRASTPGANYADMFPLRTFRPLLFVVIGH